MTPKIHHIAPSKTTSLLQPGFGDIDLHRSYLHHFELDRSYFRELQRIADLQPVGCAKSRPPLSEGAKRLFPPGVRGSLHAPWRQRPGKRVRYPIEALHTVDAPIPCWDVLRTQ